MSIMIRSRNDESRFLFHFILLNEHLSRLMVVSFNRRVDLFKGVAALVSSRHIIFYFVKEFIRGSSVMTNILS